MSSHNPTSPDSNDPEQFFDSDIYDSYAEGLLADILPPDSQISSDLALYLRVGTLEELNRTTITDVTEEDPAATFIDKTGEELRKDPVGFVKKLRTWAEIREQEQQTQEEPQTQTINPESVAHRGLFATHRQKHALAEQERAQEAARQQEIQDLRHTSFNEKRIPVSAFKPGDRVVMTLQFRDRESTCILAGDVIRHGSFSVRDGERYHEKPAEVKGMLMKLASDSRFGNRKFAYDQLPVDAEIVVSESAYSNGYVSKLGNILQGDVPNLFWGGEKVRIGFEYTDYRRSDLDMLHLDQITVNDIGMFPPIHSGK